MKRVRMEARNTKDSLRVTRKTDRRKKMYKPIAGEKGEPLQKGKAILKPPSRELSGEPGEGGYGYVQGRYTKREIVHPKNENRGYKSAPYGFRGLGGVLAKEEPGS